MSLRNYFYRFGKYILTFFFVTLLMVLFSPLRGYHQGSYLGWF